jgi:hypothetical protein
MGGGGHAGWFQFDRCRTPFSGWAKYRPINYMAGDSGARAEARRAGLRSDHAEARHACDPIMIERF